MVAMSIFLLMVSGFLSVNLFGMREDELVNSKLGANDQSRLTFNLLTEEIRSAKVVLVGTGSRTNFTPVANGQTQQGNALQIFPFSNNTNFYVVYYFDAGTNNPATNELHRITTTNTDYHLVVKDLTNTMFFQATDYTGTNVLTQSPTNYNHNYVINAVFQFYQFQYPLTKVGPGYLYDYYKIQLQATRRCP
jgi:Tfp pilus assembly protein PilW